MIHLFIYLSRHSYYIITGSQGEGKITFVKELAALFKKDGFKCSGFYPDDSVLSYLS